MERFILDEERVKKTIDNYKRIKNDVAETAIKAGRSENDVRLMCVTKTVEAEYINPVLDLGADLIGENRVQEYLSKRDSLHLDGVEKHLIGHLQTNKVKQIVGQVDMIESVDSVHLAKEISKQSAKSALQPMFWLRSMSARRSQRVAFILRDLTTFCVKSHRCRISRLRA